MASFVVLGRMRALTRHACIIHVISMFAKFKYLYSTLAERERNIFFYSVDYFLS